MKVKWGAAVVDGRGKINGWVFAKNRGGNYARVKVTPVNPQTIPQQSARSLLSTFSSGWSGLTQAERDSWNGAVSAFAKTDVFGDLRNPTGKNLYTKLNVNLDLINETNITVPPLVAAIVESQITAVAIDIGAGDVYTATLDQVSAGQTYLVWATPPVSQGKSFVKNDYRLIGTHDAATGTTIDFKADYETRFGVATAGQKVFVKVVPVVDATGQAGIGSTNFTTVLDT
jgi:hypothetical protein